MILGLLTKSITVLRLQQGGLGWKSQNNLVTISAEDISHMQWMRFVRACSTSYTAHTIRIPEWLEISSLKLDLKAIDIERSLMA